MKFGAGRGFAGKTLLLTLGTGVGSALAYHGTVVPCEFGHVPHKGKSYEKICRRLGARAGRIVVEEMGPAARQYIGLLERILGRDYHRRRP